MNLLDTHTLIWFVNGDEQLSNKARVGIEQSTNFVSIASLWEIAIKISLGKLELHTPFIAIEKQLELNQFTILPITFKDTLHLSNLPFYHRDPFDRLLIAQSITNNLTLVF
jgi:PIN domain nuclease of toxin-antitoxin system